MDVRRRLGLNLKRLRGEKGWSQEKFAFEAEIYRTYISDLERGVRNPTIIIVEKLAASLGVDPSDLLRLPPNVTK